MSVIRKSRPKDGPAAHRQAVIDAVGLAQLGEFDLMKVRTKDDADRAIARFARKAQGPMECLTSSGTKVHYARDRFRTLCGFKIAVAYERDGGAQTAHSRHARGLGYCAMCVNIHEKEDA